MKKLLLLSLVLASVMVASIQANNRPCDSCDCEISSRSYLSVSPLFRSASPEMISGFRNDRVHAREDGWHGALQIVAFGGSSRNSQDLARYFLPFCKTSLIVDEKVDSPEGQDLLASHFNIFTRSGTFRSEISIRPRQSVVGLGLHYRQSFLRDEDRDRAFWYSVSFPIQRVKNDLNFCELVIDDGDGPKEDPAEEVCVANMKQAFQQRKWNAGKISPCPMRKTKVADIEVKIGYEWLQHDPYHLESYVGVVIPTGNKPTGEFLFEPIVGNGHHGGVMFGSAVGLRIWQNEEETRNLRIEYAMHTQYLFSNTQCRSVDLFCKPWSRYMEVYKDRDQAEKASLDSNATLATPGINVFTLPLRVRPGFSYNITTAAVYTGRKFQAEGGHRFYCRRSECVKLACAWQEGPALKHKNGDGRTNPGRDITGNIFLEVPDTSQVDFDNYDDNVIKEKDLDLVSASHPCMLSHTLYGALSYRWDERKYPTFVNGGSSYEFSTSNNAVLSRWTVWAKLGFSF